MTRFWTSWLAIWCAAVAVFGIVLMGGAFPATDGPVRLIIAALNPAADTAMPGVLRFSLALMGAVTAGWAATLYAAVRAANALGAAGAPIWRLLTWSVAGWYVVDSSLSVATGFGLNAVSNTLFLAAFLVPVLASGVVKRSAAATASPETGRETLRQA